MTRLAKSLAAVPPLPLDLRRLMDKEEEFQKVISPSAGRKIEKAIWQRAALIPTPEKLHDRKRRERRRRLLLSLLDLALED